MCIRDRGDERTAQSRCAAVAAAGQAVVGGTAPVAAGWRADRNAHHHLLECKFSESVNEAALQQALSYDYFYRQTQQLKADELQTYVVSAQTPRAALLQRFGYQRAEHPGVYVTGQPMLEKVVLLVLNELRDAPQNEFLRLFASRQVVRKQTIDNVLQQPLANWPEPFWAVLFGLQRVCLLYTSPSPRDRTRSRMPSSA